MRGFIFGSFFFHFRCSSKKDCPLVLLSFYALLDFQREIKFTRLVEAKKAINRKHQESVRLMNQIEKLLQISHSKLAMHLMLRKVADLLRKATD